MKVQKGFNMSKEEVEKSMKMNMNNFKTNVSHNLGAQQIDSSNMVAGIVIDDNKLNKFKTGQVTNPNLLNDHEIQKPSTNMPKETNLLDFGGSSNEPSPQKQEPLDMLKELGEVLGKGIQQEYNQHLPNQGQNQE